MNDFNTAKANAQVLLGDANASQAQIDNVATFGGGALLLARWRQQGDR